MDAVPGAGFIHGLTEREAQAAPACIRTKPPRRAIRRIAQEIARCLKQVPPGDFIAALSQKETQFLIEHGLGGPQVTIRALDELEAEPRTAPGQAGPRPPSP